MSAIAVHFFLGSYYLPTVGEIDFTNWIGQLTSNPGAVFGPPHWAWLGSYWGCLSISAIGLSTVITFMVKVAVIVFIFMWIRATLPRLRYDQLMRFGWKFMLPAGLVLVFLTSVLMTTLPDASDNPGADQAALTSTQEVPNG